LQGQILKHFILMNTDVAGTNIKAFYIDECG